MQAEHPKRLSTDVRESTLPLDILNGAIKHLPDDTRVPFTTQVKGLFRTSEGQQSVFFETSQAFIVASMFGLAIDDVRPLGYPPEHPMTFCQGVVRKEVLKKFLSHYE